MNDLVLRLQFDNNNKLIIKVSQEDTTSSLIEKIKSLYALHYSKLIQLGSLKDDKGFEIINDIKLSSIFRNGDVLCVFVKEIGDFKSSNTNGLINYDYKNNNNKESKEESKDINLSKVYNMNINLNNPPKLSNSSIIPNPPVLSNPPIIIPNPPKNINLTSLPKTKLPIKEEERSLTMNPIKENIKEDLKENNKKPRKRRNIKPKEEEKKNEVEDKKIKKNEVEDKKIKKNEVEDKKIKKNEVEDKKIKKNEVEDKKIKKNEVEDKKIKKNEMEDKKIKKNEVEDPFSVFEDLKKKNLNDKNPIDTPSKIQPPVLNPIPKENKKDIKELKKKSKVDYNKVDN